MIKRLLLTVALVLAVGGIGSAAINNIIGASVSGPKPDLPLSAVVLCQAPEFCTRIAVPDWSNEDVFYGTDGNDCRKSIDGGDTWNDCGANPSATVVMNDYAVTMNGTVLAAANDGGGTVFRISRSTDGAASWSFVYSSTPVDGMTTFPTNGRLRCARTANLCTFYGRAPTAGNDIFSLTSIDDGLTWALTTGIGVSSVGWQAVIMNQDGTQAFANVNAGDGFTATNRTMLFDGVSWSRAPLTFATTAGGLCNWAFLLNGTTRTICHSTGLGTTFNMMDEVGNIQTTFTIPDFPSGNGTAGIGQAISVRTNAIHFVGTTTTGRTGFWVSADAGVSFTKIFETDGAGSGISSQGSIYEGVNGCIYTAYLVGGASSTVVRIC